LTASTAKASKPVFTATATVAAEAAFTASHMGHYYVYDDTTRSFELCEKSVTAMEVNHSFRAKLDNAVDCVAFDMLEAKSRLNAVRKFALRFPTQEAVAAHTDNPRAFALVQRDLREVQAEYDGFRAEFSRMKEELAPVSEYKVIQLAPAEPKAKAVKKETAEEARTRLAKAEEAQLAKEALRHLEAKKQTDYATLESTPTNFVRSISTKPVSPVKSQPPATSRVARQEKIEKLVEAVKSGDTAKVEALANEVKAVREVVPAIKPEVKKAKKTTSVSAPTQAHTAAWNEMALACYGNVELTPGQKAAVTKKVNAGAPAKKAAQKPCEQEAWKQLALTMFPEKTELTRTEKSAVTRAFNKSAQ
jgi:hypothetical protein